MAGEVLVPTSISAEHANDTIYDLYVRQPGIELVRDISHRAHQTRYDNRIIPPKRQRRDPSRRQTQEHGESGEQHEPDTGADDDVAVVLTHLAHAR